MSRTLLAIETSCDETAAAVVDEALSVRSSVVASQIDLHAAFGGVVPELASRAHVETVTPVVARALHEAGVSGEDLTAVAVTSGPGLVGALLVGIATAKALALGWGIPVVGVNHLEGHLASVYLADPEVPFPQIALLVSGGHCMLTRCTEPGRYELLGETVDDSIGEAYDKVARFLGLGYPGGPVLDRLAAAGGDVLGFPRPMLGEGYAFSFSGLKTAVVNHVRSDPGFSEAEVAASFVAACMDVLIAKLRRALEEFGDPAVAIVGGVAASPILRARAQVLADEFGARAPDSAPRHGHGQCRDDRGGRLAQVRGRGRQRAVLRAGAGPAPPLLLARRPPALPAPARPVAEGLRREVEQHAEGDDEPAERVDALSRRVDEGVEEGRVRQGDEADDPGPARMEGDRQAVREDPEQEDDEAWRNRCEECEEAAHGSVETDHIAVVVYVDPFCGRTAREPGHGPHVPADQIDESGTHIGPGLAHREPPSPGCTPELGIR